MLGKACKREGERQGMIYRALWEGPVNSREPPSPRGCGGEGPGAVPAQPAVRRGCRASAGEGSCILGELRCPTAIPRVQVAGWHVGHRQLPPRVPQCPPCTRVLPKAFVCPPSPPSLQSPGRTQGDFPQSPLTPCNLRIPPSPGGAIPNLQSADASELCLGS